MWSELPHGITGTGVIALKISFVGRSVPDICVWSSHRIALWECEEVKGPACLRGAQWYGVMPRRLTDKLIHLLTLLTRLSDFVKWTIDPPPHTHTPLSYSRPLSVFSDFFSSFHSFHSAISTVYNSFICKLLPSPCFHPTRTNLSFLIWLANWQPWHVW